MASFLQGLPLEHPLPPLPGPGSEPSGFFLDYAPHQSARPSALSGAGNPRCRPDAPRCARPAREQHPCRAAERGARSSAAFRFSPYPIRSHLVQHAAHRCPLGELHPWWNPLVHSVDGASIIHDPGRLSMFDSLRHSCVDVIRTGAS